ncbi:MAG: hypothetical protein ABI216_18660 [Devosia sp.]
MHFSISNTVPVGITVDASAAATAVNLDTPMTLAKAITLPELGGVVTLHRFRTAIAAGELVAERHGARIFVTMTSLREWRLQCQDKAREHDSGSSRLSSNRILVRSGNTRRGSSETATAKSALAALRATARARKKALADHLAAKYTPDLQKGRAAARVSIAEVLQLYQEEVVPGHARPEKTDQRLLQLAAFWGDKTLADVSGRSCRAYVDWRCRQPWKSAKPKKTGKVARMVTPAGARRELEDLRAAISHHRREGHCREVVEVTLPSRSPAADRWLTRDEAARLLWICWTHREMQTIGRGVRRGQTARPVSALGGTWRGSFSSGSTAEHAQQRSAAPRWRCATDPVTSTSTMVSSIAAVPVRLKRTSGDHR